MFCEFHLNFKKVSRIPNRKIKTKTAPPQMSLSWGPSWADKGLKTDF